MNIQKLRLIGFVKVLKGGSTKPILITAYDENNNIKQYVLKTYNKDHIEKNFSVAKEVLACEIAKVFDLPVPNYGLINFDHSLLKNLLTRQEINEIDEGYKFCSEFLPIGPIFISLAKASFLKKYDIENVFAFNNLIINVDRGGHRNKPNLLVSDTDFLMIDHELSLHFFKNSNIDKSLNFEQIFKSFKTFDKHIFYNPIKKLRKKEKDHLFNEFIEVLRHSNFLFLEGVFMELERFNVKVGEKNHIFAYFNWVKANYNIVRTLLLSRVQ